MPRTVTKPPPHRSPGAHADHHRADAPLAPPDAASRGRRWLRVVIVLLVVVTVGYWLLTSSFLTRWAVTGALGRALGAEVSAASVTVSPFGHVLARDARVRVPGLAGPAGEVFRVEKLTARVHLWRCLRGDPVIYALNLERPVVRLSRSRDGDGSVNIAGLGGLGGSAPARPVPGGSGTAPTPAPVPTPTLASIPTLFVWDGQVEVGEHTTRAEVAVHERYSVLKQLRISGRVQQSADDSGASVIQFRQTPVGEDGAPDPDAGSTSGEGLIARGRIWKDGVSLTIAGVDLAAVRPENIPAQARELYKQTQLAGQVPEATLTYLFTGQWESAVTLRGVALTLPVEAQPDEDDEGNPIPVPPEERGRRLRLLDTSGQVRLTNTTITADLEGTLESLPYSVRLEVDGTSPSSAFRCTLSARNVLVESQPEVLKFTPGLARRRLRDFGNPTGPVDASVTIARDALTDPANPPPLRVEGVVHLRGLTAAFHKFPYPWTNLTGTVRFDDQAVRFERITGVALVPTGLPTRITADGAITPPDDEAKVDITFLAEDIPVDENLRAAMRARGQEKVIDELFDPIAYQRLLDRGLVRARAEDPSNALPTPAPVFALGGALSVQVRVQRVPGPGSVWTDTVDIRLPEAGLLLRALPYPILAQDVLIARDVNNVVTVREGRFRPLGGGELKIQATADLNLLDAGGEFVPTVRASARGVPIDPVLLAALPTLRGEADRAPRPLGELLAPLAPRGLVDADATVHLDEAMRTRYDVNANVREGVLAPAGAGPSAQPRVRVESVQASVRVNEREARVEATGTLVPTTYALLPEATPAPGAFTLWAPTGREQDGGASDQPTRMTIRLQELPVALHAEDVLRPFAPGPAARLDALRAEYTPRGAVGLSASIELPVATPADPDPATRGEVRVGPMRDVVLSLPVEEGADAAAGVDLAIDPSGSVMLRLGPAPTLEGAVRATLPAPTGGPGEADTVLALEGLMDATTVQPIDARLSVAKARLEDPAIRALARRFAPVGVSQRLQAWDVQGTVDMALAFSPVPGRRESVVRGSVRPARLAATIDGMTITAPRVAGAVELLGDGGGRFDELALVGEDWSAMLGGGWLAEPDGSRRADVRVQLAAQSLTDELRALAPPTLRAALEDLRVRIAGPLAIDNMLLQLRWSPEEEEATHVLAQGALTATEASADLGVPVTEAAGTFRFDYALTPQQPAGALTLGASLPSLRVAGITLTDASATVLGNPDGTTSVPDLAAIGHGGRVAGSLRIGAPAGKGPHPRNARRPFALDVETSGVRFNPLLAELRGQAAPGAGDELSRGLLSGGFALAGVTNDAPGTPRRRGRGTLTIRGGNVLDLPLLVPLVRATNLQLPTTEQLDYALVDLYIQGKGINFEQANISSKSVGLYGVGFATWPEMALDMRFRTMARDRIPILTPILEGIRGELITARVTGTLDNPEMTTERFSATRAALDDLLGRSTTDGRRRMDELEQGVSPTDRRARPDEAPPIDPIEPPRQGGR